MGMASPSYSRVATSEEGEPAARRGAHRCVVVSLLGLLAAFYMFLSVRSATTAPQALPGRQTALSLLGRYEKHKLVTENAALKVRLEALQDQLHRREEKAMTAAKDSAARPTVERPAAAAGGGGGGIAGGLAAAAAAAATPGGRPIWRRSRITSSACNTASRRRRRSATSSCPRRGTATHSLCGAPMGAPAAAR